MTAVPSWIQPLTSNPAPAPRLGGSDPGPEAARGPDGGRLAHVAGGVEERDRAQQRGARPAREALGERLGPRPEGARGGGPLDRVGLQPPVPVPGPEGRGCLARAVPQRVPVLSER